MLSVRVVLYGSYLYKIYYEVNKTNIFGAK